MVRRLRGRHADDRAKIIVFAVISVCQSPLQHLRLCKPEAAACLVMETCVGKASLCRVQLKQHSDKGTQAGAL